MKFDQEFPTRDHITHIHVKADIVYQVVDGELVAIGFEDALQSMRDEIATLFKREIGRLTHEQIDDEYLEGILMNRTARFSGWIGIRIHQVGLSTEMDKSFLDDLRQDRQRRRNIQIENEDRLRKRQLEREDIDNVNEVLHQLGMSGLPGDARLKLLSMPREKAFEKIGEYIQQQRAAAQSFAIERAKQEYEMLRDLIGRGVLEDFELQDFGKTLLDRYSRVLAAEEILGAPPELLFGTGPRAILGDSKHKKNQKKLTTEKDEEDNDTERE